MKNVIHLAMWIPDMTGYYNRLCWTNGYLYYHGLWRHTNSDYKPAAGVKYHNIENVKSHNCTWHSAVQSTIREVLESPSNTVKNQNNSGFNYSQNDSPPAGKGTGLSQTSSLASLCNLWGNLSLSLSAHWSQYVSHHQRVLIKRVKERVLQWG